MEIFRIRVFSNPTLYSDETFLIFDLFRTEQWRKVENRHWPYQFSSEDSQKYQQSLIIFLEYCLTDYYTYVFVCIWDYYKSTVQSSDHKFNNWLDRS